MDIPAILVIGAGIAAFIGIRVGYGLSRDLRSERQQSAKAREEAEDAEIRRGEMEVAYSRLQKILIEKSSAMPWLAQMIADANWLNDNKDITYLRTKKRPAVAASAIVKQHAQEKKELRIAKRLTEYKLAFYESLFPWLEDIAYADAEEIAEAARRDSNQENENDPAAAWLSHDEWEALPPADRYQRALDRYRKRKKSNWQIGREFERYVGFHWERQGYDVVYHGAIKGFEDFGRDLIVTGKTGKIALIQCKYWSSHKTIPEAAVFQLLGSTVSFFIEKTGRAPDSLVNLMQSIQPYLYTSATLDPKIKDIAAAMGIKVKDQMPMQDWPMVKCNVAADGELIYHLPMDQMYDRVKICKANECYVWTVAEAEKLGFRRAKRWFGDGTE
jgi:Restriction endonuclease